MLFQTRWCQCSTRYLTEIFLKPSSYFWSCTQMRVVTEVRTVLKNEAQKDHENNVKTNRKGKPYSPLCGNL